jgi:hypothetical protein
VKPSSSTQAAKSKTVSHLEGEPVELRAGELKVLIILTTGIPKNAFSGVCRVSVKNTPSAELESIRIAVSPR